MRTHRLNRLSHLTDQEILTAYRQSVSFSDWARKLGFAEAGGARYYQLKKKAIALGLSPIFPSKKSRSHPRYVSDETYFKKGTLHGGNEMRRRIIKERLLPYRCSICGQQGTWKGKPLSLQIDHKNGDHSDNRICNLRFLCPNCHSQTSTFSGRNIHKISVAKVIQKCHECGAPITRFSKSGLCPRCSMAARRHCQRPSREQFISDLLTSGFRGTARLYGLSESGIRGWCSFYGLPRKISVLKKIFSPTKSQ